MTQALLFASLMAPGSVALAQLSVGVTFGPGNTSLSGDKPDKASYSSRTGLVAGAIIEYQIKPDVRISFQPGISQSGTTISFKIAGVEEKRDSLAIKLDYVNLPLLARVVTDGGGWYVTGGPYLGLLQSANGTPEGGGEDVD
ncbi:MAG: porin family protein, partial [Rhodothermia bacterium]